MKNIPQFVKNAFSNGFNLLMISVILIGSILDLGTTRDTTGGIAFFGVIIFSYMLIVEYKNLQIKELTDEKDSAD